MIVYGCPLPLQAALAAGARRRLSGLPVRVVVCRDGGVGVELVIRGRDRAAKELRRECFEYIAERMAGIWKSTSLARSA